METELFGHVRGAFTGALSDRTGAFSQAEHGTLFLDEIGDMNIAMQAKILRALQERIVAPVGGKPVAVDVRVIAATHRDLRTRIADGRFREDLFFRLHVVPIHLPALRERIADILPLAEYFLGQAGGGKRLSADAAARLIRHAWPGNVRELKNAMERAAVLVRGEAIDVAELSFVKEHPPASDRVIEWPDEDLPTALARLEEMLIRRALQRSDGNRAEASRMLNIHRQLLYSKMKRYGLDLYEDRTQGVGEADVTKP
jgi:DNA-binding NtrC family response regulator